MNFFGVVFICVHICKRRSFKGQLIVTEVFGDFPCSLQANTGVMPQLAHDHNLYVYCMSYLFHASVTEIVYMLNVSFHLFPSS
jgi:hypothetical protein